MGQICVDGFSVAILVYARNELIPSKPEFLSITQEHIVRAADRPLAGIYKEPVMHGPIGRSAILARAARGVSRCGRLWMNGIERKVIVDQHDFAIGYLVFQ